MNIRTLGISLEHCISHKVLTQYTLPATSKTKHPPSEFHILADSIASLSVNLILCCIRVHLFPNMSSSHTIILLVFTANCDMYTGLPTDDLKSNNYLMQIEQRVVYFRDWWIVLISLAIVVIFSPFRQFHMVISKFGASSIVINRAVSVKAIIIYPTNESPTRKWGCMLFCNKRSMYLTHNTL